jgi:hypothetical protein
MPIITPEEDLAGLKRLMRALKGEEPGYKIIMRDGAGNDLAPRELPILERELAYLEHVVAERKKNA